MRGREREEARENRGGERREGIGGKGEEGEGEWKERSPYASKHRIKKMKEHPTEQKKLLENSLFTKSPQNPQG